MDELLAAIKAALQASSGLSYIGDADIFVSGGGNLPPPGVVLPALGVEMVAVRNEQKIGSRYLQYADIAVMIYQRQTVLPDEAIVGGLGTEVIAGDVKSCLTNNQLGFTDGSGQIMASFPAREGKNEKVKLAGVECVRKSVTFQYFRNMYS